jgi:hypothetical protein
VPISNTCFFEIGDELGGEANLLQVKGFKKLAGAEKAVEGDPQCAGCFTLDFDPGIAQSCSDLSQARDLRLGTRQVVGDVGGCDHLVVGEFAHGLEGDLLQVADRTDT